MPEAIRRANNAKSKIRSRVEHVFAARAPDSPFPTVTPSLVTVAKTAGDLLRLDFRLTN